MVSGNIHPSPDGSTATAAADLLVIYNYLNAVQPDIELLYPAQFGENLELTPHTYIMNGATALTDTVYLNAQDNADAVFLIKIYGAFTAHTYSKVVLKNGAQAKNIFWMVNGAVDINDYAIINGTIISQGAVNLFTGADLIGRILTGVGAIETNTVDAAADIIPANCQTVVGETVSLNELNAQTSASLYPNPFSNTLTVSIAKTELDNYFIQVYNTLGKEIINTELRNETTILNTENLPAGVYFIRSARTTISLKAVSLSHNNKN